MEFKEVTNNIANMFFPNIGLGRPVDKGFSDFVKVDDRKNSVHSKDEQNVAISQSPKKDIVRKDVDVPKSSKSQKTESQKAEVVKIDEKDASSESLNLNEVSTEIVVEEVFAVDELIIAPEVLVDQEEGVSLEVAYVEPVILEDSLLKATIENEDIKPVMVEAKVDDLINDVDESVVKLDELEVVSPEEFIEPEIEIEIEKNVEQKIETEVVFDGKSDVKVVPAFVPDRIKNIEVVDLDGKESKKASTQKIISNDFELVKMLNSDDSASVPMESLDNDEFIKVVDKEVVVSKDVSFEEVVEISLEELTQNPEEVVDVAFVSDDVADVDSLVVSTPIVSEVKKFDTVIDEKVSLRDAFKGMSKEAVEQVKVNITKSAIQGLSKIDIHLKPEGLGMVEIKLNIGKDGKMQANIVASRVETMEALQKDSVVLAKSLNEAGFDMSSDDFNFSFANKDDGSDRKGLKQFISKTLREDAEMASYEKEFINSSAVNIRV